MTPPADVLTSPRISSAGVPGIDIQKRRQAVADRVTGVCDHLQAAMFHLSNDRGDLARRSLRMAAHLHSQMISHRCTRPPELDAAVEAGLSWIATPASYRTLVQLCQATITLVEWRSVWFTDSLYRPARKVS